jgi:hypothetical protein
MQDSLLSVDPGKNTGWAYFEKAQLVACGLVVCLDTCGIEKVTSRIPSVSSIVVEVPQVYAGPRAVGDPNDLIQVEQGLGKRFIASTGKIHWFVPFAPIGFNEVCGSIEGHSSITTLGKEEISSLAKALASSSGLRKR